MDENRNVPHMPIVDCIRSANEMFVELLKTNELFNVLQTIEPFCDQSIYHCFGKALAMILIAFSSMDKVDIEVAAEVVADLQKMTNKYRRTGFMTSVIKMVTTPNYQKYTDLELHSEMIHTLSIGLSIVVMALNTHNIYGLIKCAFRGQRFIKNFNSCKVIIKMKTDWESIESQQNFEACVRLVNGFCHLAISRIPPKILRVANFLGYRGVESVGFEQINISAFQLQGMFSQAARMSLIAYWLYGEPHGGLGPKQPLLVMCEEVLNKELEMYPNSIVFVGAKTKLEEVKGNIDVAIHNYEQLVERSDQSAHKLYHAELMFCQALKCEWSECIKYAQLVHKNSIHSPACTTYAEAVFRYAKSIDDDDPDERRRATELFEIVPTIRIRHLGKTITPEKVAVVNSEKYFKNNECLILPEVEILYQLNWFAFIKRDKKLLNKHLQRIEREVNKYSNDLNKSDSLDNYLSALFYKGVFYRLLGRYSDAIKCFKDILENEPRLVREFSIPPQTCLELGLTELDANNSYEAKQWLNKAIDDYSGYTNENYVHIRAYSGLRELGVCTDKHEANDEKLQEYKKQWLKDIKVDNKSYETIIQSEETRILH